jgi:hypothetical protein
MSDWLDPNCGIYYPRPGTRGIADYAVVVSSERAVRWSQGASCAAGS